tara:strand:- start:1447 stop:1977 length:531 start_codon:yes stop_codon:yes gene_type:complete
MTREGIVEKWSKTGLLQGLEEKRAEMTANLLENQAKYVLMSTGHPPKEKPRMWTPESVDIVFPAITRVFRDLDLDWDIMTLPAALPDDGDAVVAMTHTLTATVQGPTNDDIAEQLSSGMPIADIEFGQRLKDAIIPELKEKWKDKKIWIYVPLIFSRIGKTNEYNILMRYGSRDKV